MARTETRMVALGYGKYVRADRIVMVEPLDGDDRGNGQRTRVWIEGVADPVLASRTERAILVDMGALPEPAQPRERVRAAPPAPPSLFDDVG